VVTKRRMAAAIGSLLAVAAVVALAPPAGAAEQTETANIPPTVTDFAQPVTVAQFDPSLGILTAVNISATVNTEGSIAVENTSEAPISVTLNLVTISALTGPGFGPVNAEATTEGQLADLEPSDDMPDFNGPDSALFTGLTATGTASVSLTSNLEPYIGTGNVAFPLDTTTTFSGAGPGGNVQVRFANVASVQLTVTYVYQAPAIDIEKATNGEDADTPTGPQIAIGAPVEWTYVVTNTGDQPLAGVTVTDDQGVAVTCPQATLEPGESMTCTASGIAEEGQYANIGTTTGQPQPTGPTVTDSDPSHYIGVQAPPPTTAPPAPPPTTTPGLPVTGSTSLPLGVIGTVLGLLGVWGILAARKLAWSLLVDRDVDALAKEMPTWNDPGRPR
jgi:hypothetical protein